MDWQFGECNLSIPTVDWQFGECNLSIPTVDWQFGECNLSIPTVDWQFGECDHYDTLDSGLSGLLTSENLLYQSFDVSVSFLLL